MGKIPKYNCLTNPYCSFLDPEISHFPTAATFSPIQLWESDERNSKPASKPGKSASRVAGGDVLFSFADHLILCRGCSMGKAKAVFPCVIPSLPVPVPPVRAVFPCVTGCPTAQAHSQLSWRWLSTQVEALEGSQHTPIHHPGTACAAFCFGNFTPQSFWNWLFTALRALLFRYFLS